MKKIIIGGDFVPTKSNEKYFIDNNLEELFGKDLYNLISTADYKIFNLEAPITNETNKLSKEGPNLKINPLIESGLKTLKINLLSLANNHILDYCEKGLFETINILKNNKISYVGVGKNIDEAANLFEFTIDNIKFGVYACTEHEYTLATTERFGANSFDPLNSLDHISEGKKKVDYLIVLYHGGKEFYKYPSPYLQKVCRKIADKGADLILCQHSHCIGSIEKYKNTTILYGQGNFLFDRDDPIHFEDKQLGLITVLNINNGIVTVDFFPIKKVNEKVKLLLNKESNKILAELKARSKKVYDKKFINDNYKQVAQLEGSRYILRMSKVGSILSAVDNKFFKGKVFRKNFHLLNLRQRHTLENMLQCEVHNELVLTYLKNENERNK